MDNQLRHIRSTQTLQLIVAVLALHLWQIGSADRGRLHRELEDFETTIRLARDIESQPEKIRVLVPTISDLAQEIANAISDESAISVHISTPIHEVRAITTMPDPRAALQLQWAGLLAQEWELRSIGSVDTVFGAAKQWLQEWRNCNIQLERQINRLRTRLGSSEIARIKRPIVRVAIVHPSMSYEKLKIEASITASIPTDTPQRLVCRNAAPSPHFGFVTSTDVPGIYSETVYFATSNAPVGIDRVRFASQRLNRYPLIRENLSQLGPMTLDEAKRWAEDRYFFAPYAPGMGFSPLQHPFTPVFSRFYHVGITLIVLGFALQIYVWLSILAGLQNTKPDDTSYTTETRSVWLLLLHGEAADLIRICHCILLPTSAIVFASMAIMMHPFPLILLAILMVCLGVAVVVSTIDLRNQLTAQGRRAGKSVT